MATTYEQRQYRCLNPECEWTDFEPFTFPGENKAQCQRCSQEYPPRSFKRRTETRELRQ